MRKLIKCRYINPAVLQWARNSLNYTLDEISKKFKKIDDWENGKDFPTYKQLESLSNKYKRPIAIFFFPIPPQEETIETSFRTVRIYEQHHAISHQLRYLLRKAKVMQIDLAELNDGRNHADKQIVNEIRCNLSTDQNELVQKIRSYLNIPISLQETWRSAADAFEQWRHVFAKHGIFVFKDTFNDKRQLKSDISGFCLYDKSFPIIYINNSTSYTRQIFTLFHELAHLLFRINGIDTQDKNYIEYLKTDNQVIESFCNKFAGNFLVPTKDLIEHIKGKQINEELIQSLAKKTYKVSNEVILRRLLDCKVIDQRVYDKKISALQEIAKTYSKPKKAGGDYFNTQIAYLGKEYLSMAFQKYYQGSISTEQLAEYLQVSPKSIDRLEHKFLRAET